ncbi:YciI family protein [Cellulomonas biazotea]|uniref:Transcription initiation protein n=1 Tax=Cellulomonas biazotea TaxID=1709 RepID=A0A402DLW2_9CELL|nr:YciI family protein [Cellulomonas biazotea]GCE75124.1 transcription initiation protein [Cellulomonas biazotea]
MRYLMLVCTDPTGDTDTVEGDGDIVTWLDETGTARLHGDRLRPAEEARTVRVRGDRTLVTDGPFAETQEQIAGYDVLECDSLEHAVAIAAKHPMARFGRIEVREFWPIPD